MSPCEVYPCQQPIEGQFRMEIKMVQGINYGYTYVDIVSLSGKVMYHVARFPNEEIEQLYRKIASEPFWSSPETAIRDYLTRIAMMAWPSN